MAIETLAARTGATPLRIRRVQKITLTLLFIAGIVNFRPLFAERRRGGDTRRPGLSATEFGVLLSAFRSPTASRNCPPVFCWIAGATDCAGRRADFLVRNAGPDRDGQFVLAFYSAARIGLGIGEAPFMPAGVKSINDWYAQRARHGGGNIQLLDGAGRLSPAGPGHHAVGWGWRTMFVVIGLAGIVVGLCWYVGYRNRRQFTLQEEEQQYLASEEAARPALKFSEWLALFKRRTTG